jgi:hypothetical protein
MRKFHRISTSSALRFGLAAVVSGGLFAGAAAADVSDVFFSIHAVSGALEGTFEVMTEDVTYDPGNDSWMWFGAGIVIDDDDTGAPIGTLNYALITVQADPQVNMTFNVQSGAGPTAFMISTATLNFPTLTNPDAQATVGFTLTDSDPFGAGDGEASVDGAGPTGGAYVAEYNVVPPGTVYTEQISGLSITGDPSGSTSTSAADPPIGFSTIPGGVSSIRAYSSFVLSANDQASSTSQFTVVPEPATGLALLFACALLRRR